MCDRNIKIQLIQIIAGINMYSTLLLTVALLSSHVCSADVVLPAKDGERQDREYWPSDNSRYLEEDLPSQIPVDGSYYDASQLRQNPWGLSNINSAVNPIANFMNNRPGTFIANPNIPNLLRQFDSCSDPSGQSGLCVPGRFCSKYGGRPSGSCSLGLVCCVNAVSKCGGLVTLNNTLWQSPADVSSDSTCGLTIALDPNLIEQKRPICQIRLDFLGFTIAQPSSDRATSSICLTDVFTVGGATNKVPNICGENTGQHMYLNAPSSTTDMTLMFSFGKSSIIRSWNIRISMLGCGSNYLAPPDCLQYFTNPTGTIQSFNWRDITTTTTRQLANQDYHICFRNPLITTQTNTRICYTQCVINNAGVPFLISGAAGGAAAVGQNCLNDFLMIRDGFDQAITTNIADRYCGGILNPLNGATTAATVCSTVRNFKIYYKTVPIEVVADIANSGFCLTYAISNTQ